MAYRITYGPEEKKVKKSGDGFLRLRLLTAVFALLFALFVKMCWPQGTSLLQAVLLPGELTVTQQAFDDMMTQIHDGESAVDAFSAFCRQVIASGENLG